MPPVSQVTGSGQEAWRVEGRGRLEHNADRFAVLIKGGDVVGKRLVFAAMPLVLLAVAQKVAVQLFDVILGDGDVLPGMEDCLRDLGIAGNLLFVAGVEPFDFQIGKQSLYLAVGEFASFDPS